jgi:hypothetical protein
LRCPGLRGRRRDARVEYAGFATSQKRADLYGNAKDVFLSKYIEPFGAVAIEAQMAGTPAITTDFGAFPDRGARRLRVPLPHAGSIRLGGKVRGSLSLLFFTLGVAAAGPGFIWSGQFEHWWFTWAIAAGCIALGLTYVDVWRLPNFGFREAESDFEGLLTTILSSACSGPFLGAVFAASLTEPWYQTITLFLLIGAGLVTPYLFFPRKWIPRPGAWMVWVKKLAGLSMIATANWRLGGSTAARVAFIFLLWLRTLADGRRRLALMEVCDWDLSVFLMLSATR